MERTLIFHYTMALIEATIYTMNKRSQTKQLGKDELAMTWRKADSFEHIPWGRGDDMAPQYLVFLVITWIPTSLVTFNAQIDAKLFKIGNIWPM